MRDLPAPVPDGQVPTLYGTAFDPDPGLAGNTILNGPYQGAMFNRPDSVQR